MYCSNCGAKISPTDINCPYCQMTNFRYKEGSGDDHPEEAQMENEKMLHLYETYPEHQNQFDKMKEACGL